jgi:hypothetical protein
MCEDDRGELRLYDLMQNSFAAFDFSQARERGDYRVVWSGGSQDVRMRQNVFVEALWEPKLGYFIPWQMCHATGTEGFWCSPPFLARLYPHLKNGELKRQIARACQRAAEAQVRMASPRPWPIHDWGLGNSGNASQSVNRVFDAYWLSRVVPDTSMMEDALRGMFWVFGPHPVNDIGYPGPKCLYSARVAGLYGIKPASIPGAVVPGPTVLSGAGMRVYRDECNDHLHNEAGISEQAPCIFAVNALKKAGC